MALEFSSQRYRFFVREVLLEEGTWRLAQPGRVVLRREKDDGSATPRERSLNIRRQGETVYLSPMDQQPGFEIAYFKVGTEWHRED